jgi:hypothetical protein
MHMYLGLPMLHDGDSDDDGDADGDGDGGGKGDSHGTGQTLAGLIQVGWLGQSQIFHRLRAPY